MNRDDCGADCGHCDVCQAGDVSAAETLTPSDAVGRSADWYGYMNHMSTPVRVFIITLETPDVSVDDERAITFTVLHDGFVRTEVPMDTLDPDEAKVSAPETLGPLSHDGHRHCTSRTCDWY